MKSYGFFFMKTVVMIFNEETDSSSSFTHLLSLEWNSEPFSIVVASPYQSTLYSINISIHRETINTLSFQMEGLLHRCECFLITHNLPFLEKVWIADR